MLLKERRVSRRDVVKDRWQSIISALTSSFSSMGYFRHDVNRKRIQKNLIESSLSWHCADAYLFLETHGNAGDIGDNAKFLLNDFRIWCESASQVGGNQISMG
jgi:hypothetical protein